MSENVKPNEAEKLEDSKVEEVNGGKNTVLARPSVRCPKCGMTYSAGSVHVCITR